MTHFWECQGPTVGYFRGGAAHSAYAIVEANRSVACDHPRSARGAPESEVP
jgi:hypothetical protein